MQLQIKNQQEMSHNNNLPFVESLTLNMKESTQSQYPDNQDFNAF